MDLTRKWTTPIEPTPPYFQVVETTVIPTEDGMIIEGKGRWITGDDLLTGIQDHDHSDCDCDECRKGRGR